MKLALLETPKTGFVATRPIYSSIKILSAGLVGTVVTQLEYSDAVVYVVLLIHKQVFLSYFQICFVTKLLPSLEYSISSSLNACNVFLENLSK